MKLAKQTPEQNEYQPITQTTAYINLDALIGNLKLLKKIAPDSKMLAIVKANAYGHGSVKVAQSCESIVDGFGVARLQEAIHLREAGIEKPILLLEGFYHQNDLDDLLKYDLQTVVHCQEQLEALETIQLKKAIQVWLKIDTGMHRLGVLPQDVALFRERLEQCENVIKPINFISHFACADDETSNLTNKQLDTFTALTQDEDICSIAASAGILAWPSSHLDWIRPGIIMYGISPFSGKTASELGFSPVMTLKSHLIAIKTIQAGEVIGYGGIWKARQDTKIGVVAIGYGDGYPRTAPNGTPVYINGRIVPVAGRVSMDMMTVDLGMESQDQLGDEVELWGQNLAIEKVAKCVDTIGYELVTQLTDRVMMSYLPFS